jgi:hypothetical protein
MSSISEIAGKPREGVHSFRVLDFAVVDIIGTGIGAFGVSKLTGWGFVPSFIGLFALGEGMHYLFKIETKFMETIGVQFDESSSELARCPFAS